MLYGGGVIYTFVHVLKQIHTCFKKILSLTVATLMITIVKRGKGLSLKQ